MRPLGIVGWICIGVVLLAQSQPHKTPEQWITEAVQLHQAGDLEKAVAAYQEYLRLRPQDARARSNLGAAFASLGRYKEAIEQYTQALQVDPYNPLVRFNLGLAYYKTAQIPRAAEELAKVVAAEPDKRNAVLLLADCLLRMGDNKKVIELLSPFGEKNPDDLAVAYLLGTALIRDDQVEKGQILVDRILRNGDSAEAHLMLGTARMAGNDFRGAVEEFEKAAALNPKLPSVHSYLGRALLSSGRREEARRAFERELEVNPHDFDANLYLGMLLREDRKLEEALQYLQRALQVRPGSPAARYQIGILYLARGDLEKSEEVLRKLVEEWPDFLEAHASLVKIYFRLKRRDEAERHRRIVRELNATKQAERRARTHPRTGEALERQNPPPAGAVAAKARPGAPAKEPGAESTAPQKPEPEIKPPGEFETLAIRAAAAREENRASEAAQLYRKLVQMRPSWLEGWWYLGTLAYDADRYSEAKRAFLRVTELRPTRGVGWAMLGLCQFALEEYKDALVSLERARKFGVPRRTQLYTVSQFHLALLQNYFGFPVRSLQNLHNMARQAGAEPSLIKAMGIVSLFLRYFPETLPPEMSDLVTRAGRAQYHMARREMEEARKAFEDLVARYPDTPNVHYSFGVFLLAVDETDKALAEFKRELEISPNHVPARQQIAFEYIRRGEPANGLRYAKEAVKLAPQSFAARNALGRILLSLGEVERAIEELETGVKLAPDSPQMHFQLARAYARAGRKEDAARERAEFQRLDKIRRSARRAPRTRTERQRPQ